MQTLEDTTAVILAGGLGTRLRSVVADRPKVLAPVEGRPFLAYLLDQLSDAGVRRAVLCTGYLGEQIEQEFGGRYAKLRLGYALERSPLGTGGGLRNALPLLDSPSVLVLNGDSYCEVDLDRFLEFHREREADASLVLAEVMDTSRYGRVELDGAGRIARFLEKSAAGGSGWINAGVYLCATALLAEIPTGPVSLERDVFPSWMSRRFFGYRGGARFLDMGTPESFAQAPGFFANLRSNP